MGADRLDAWLRLTPSFGWQTVSPSAGEFMSPLVYDAARSRLYGGNMAGAFFAVDAASGALAWTLDTGDAIVAPLGARLALNNTLALVGTFGGRLLAVNL